MSIFAIFFRPHPRLNHSYAASAPLSRIRPTWVDAQLDGLSESEIIGAKIQYTKNLSGARLPKSALFDGFSHFSRSSVDLTGF